MSWFPFHYRDVKALSNDNLALSTSSNEAARLFDSAMTQLALHDHDPVHGNLEETMAKMSEADPDMVMGQVMALSMQVMGESARKNTKLLFDVNNFVGKAKQNERTTDWQALLSQ